MSESTRLLIASETVEGIRPTAQAEIAEYAWFHEPRAGYTERCYYHRLKADKDGKTYIAVVNDELELAVLFTYNLKQLPYLTEWKLLSEGEYVLGIESGISYPDDRVETKRIGAL